MSGPSKTEQQQQQTQNTSSTQNPWDPSIPFLTGITQQGTGLLPYSGINPNENAAFTGLMSNAQSGNPYANSIAGYATNLLGGGGATAQAPMFKSGLETLQGQLGPYASGSMIGGANPQVQALLDTLSNDITGKTNAYYAGAGRDLSGANATNLTRGLASGLAPVVLGQYNTDVQRQIDAANTLYGATNTTGGILGNINQIALGNMGTGVDAATAALQSRDSAYNQMLALEAAKRNIPLQSLSALTQIGVPIAQLGGTSTGTGTRTGTVDTTQYMSPQQQAWGWMNSFANLGNAFKPGGGAIPGAAPVG